jgi:hypothetical protein
VNEWSCGQYYKRNVVLVFQLVLEKTCDEVSWGFLNRVIDRKYCSTRA